jgi:hypothetical protein
MDVSVAMAVEYNPARNERLTKQSYGKCERDLRNSGVGLLGNQQPPNGRSGLRLTCWVISGLNMRLQIYLRFTGKLPQAASEGFWIARAPIEFVSTRNPKAACEASYETGDRKARSSRVSNLSFNCGFVLRTYGRCFGAELHRKQPDG